MISDSKLGKPFSENHKLSLSKSKMGCLNFNFGKNRTNDTIIKISKSNGGKPFICNETGELFHTLAQAAEALKVHRNSVGKVLRKEYKHTGGYTFRWQDGS